MRHRFWTGLLLLALLLGLWPAAAQPAPGFADPAALATRVFLARGDERHAAVAGGELDRMGVGETVLVAITQGGQPICCAPGGSPGLIIAGDQRGGRFIPHLTQIEVVTVNSEQ